MKTLRRDLLVAFFGITFFLCMIPIFTYLYFAADLSPREALISHNDTGLELFDINNKPFFNFYQAKSKHVVPLSSVPVFTQKAIIAIEDKDFYSHQGFSIRAIIRSFWENLQGKQLVYGGSTLTQQVVKNALLNPNKSYLRKIQEIILAQEVERRYTKDQILEMYLNSVYFGEGAFGIEEAANVYFNKSAKDLDLAESAILAGILPSPSRLSLFGNLKEAKLRQKLVLEDMVKQKFISEKQRDQALDEELQITPHERDINALAPHFALMVRNELIKKYGEEEVVRSGFKVKTTLNLDWQRYAEKSVAKQVENLRGDNVSNGAAVVIDPKTSEVRALVGSKDWYDQNFGKFNIALSLRPPGSSFKPIVYIKAFEEDLITPATILQDVPTVFPNFDESKFYASFPSRAAAQAALARDPNAFYKPVDYDRRYRGPVTVRRALSNSLNIPSVAVMKKVGVEEALDSAKNLGITTLQDLSHYGLSLVLGAGEVSLLELTNVYATFANSGLRGEPALISEIKNKRGEVIYQYIPKQEQVVEPKYAFLISSILADNKSRAEVFGTVLNISRPAAVKTGTTEDFKDAWTMGYTPSLAVGVWVGNNSNTPMSGIAGSLGAAPIWKDLMEKFLVGTPIEQFEPPEGIVKIGQCGVDKAKIATASAKSDLASAAVEYFIKGTEPLKFCLNNPISTPSATGFPKPVSPPSVSSAPAPTVLPEPSAESRGNQSNDKKNSGNNKNNNEGKSKDNN